jgi:histone H3/H4
MSEEKQVLNVSTKSQRTGLMNREGFTREAAGTGEALEHLSEVFVKEVTSDAIMFAEQDGRKVLKAEDARRALAKRGIRVL